MATPAQDDNRVALLAPSPILTVTLEHGDGKEELHLHPGGQGFWVARMVRELGVGVSFCAPLGGEVGAVLRALIERERIDLCPIETSGWNGAYVHDRRDDSVCEIGETSSPRLARHEIDALYGTMLSASLEAQLTVLTGPRSEDILDSDFYRRLAADLRSNGCTVLADLSGPPLDSALGGGIDLLHLSERELGERERESGRRTAALTDEGETVTAMKRLHEEGARQVLLTRGPRPALVLLEDGLHELAGPVFEPREPRGAGDSLVAAIAASLASGRPIKRALRMGVAAGALNAARRGLGTGSLDDIQRLAGAVTLRPLEAG